MRTTRGIYMKPLVQPAYWQGENRPHRRGLNAPHYLVWLVHMVNLNFMSGGQLPESMNREISINIVNRKLESRHKSLRTPCLAVYIANTVSGIIIRYHLAHPPAQKKKLQPTYPFIHAPTESHRSHPSSLDIIATFLFRCL